MSLKSSLFLGYRFLFDRSEGRRGLKQVKGAFIGIALSLVPLVVVLVVANGMIEGITRRFVEVGTSHIQLKNYIGTDRNSVESLVQDVSAVEGVTFAFPFSTGLALAYGENGRTGVTVKGISQSVYEEDEGFRQYIEMKEGSFDLKEKDSLLLSVGVAQKLDVKPGDEVRLVIARSFPGRRPVLRPVNFTVKGIFTTGYYELDGLSAYISYEQGAALFRDPGSLSIGVKVEDPYSSLDDITLKLEEVLKPNWHVVTWYDLEKPVYKSFQTTRMLLVFIMFLIVCVAAVNISSTMVMLVLSRRQDIVILKSAGADPRDISRSFFFSGFILSAFGTCAGVAAGLVLAVNINEVVAFIEKFLSNFVTFFASILFPFQEQKSVHIKLFDPSFYLERIPVRISFQEVFLIMFVSVALGSLASYIPARRAGNIRPLEILQKH
ncbi:MAG TPA: ABC transporter permease [Spirochaetia bacterium]|nr:ABC transporter permease [Spirochaetia bacterium]